MLREETKSRRKKNAAKQNEQYLNKLSIIVSPLYIVVFWMFLYLIKGRRGFLASSALHHFACLDVSCLPPVYRGVPVLMICCSQLARFLCFSLHCIPYTSVAEFCILVRAFGILFHIRIKQSFHRKSNFFDKHVPIRFLLITKIKEIVCNRQNVWLIV